MQDWREKGRTNPNWWKDLKDAKGDHFLAVSKTGLMDVISRVLKLSLNFQTIFFPGVTAKAVTRPG